MIYLFLFLFSGIAAGFVFRSREGIIKAADSLSLYAVYFLLLSLGLTIGLSREIISNIGSLGFSSLVIALGSVFGSVTAVQLVGKILLKNGEHS